jgi:predicted transcriptional regulator
VAEDRSGRLNLQLDPEHMVKLDRVAKRLYLQPGTVGRSLLYTILDQIELDAVTMTNLLDAIPGARERAQAGLADAAAGRVIDLDDL